MLSENVLEEIRGEIAEREAELEEWRELERLAVKLRSAQADASSPEPPAPPPPKAPRQSRPRPRGSGNGPAEQRKQAALAVLSSRGPLSPRAVAKAIGESAETVKVDLRELLAEGKLSAQGATKSRTYDVAERSNGSASSPEVFLGERPLESAIADVAGVDSL